MEHTEWTSYEAALRAKAAELMAELNRRDGLAMEAEPDVFDQIQRAADRALVVQVLDQSSALMSEIRVAMERMKDGTYGRCLECDGIISPKRLSAVPWASLCLKCQEAADRVESENRWLDEFAPA